MTDEELEKRLLMILRVLDGLTYEEQVKLLKSVMDRRKERLL